MNENHIHVEPPRMIVIAATGALAILALFLFVEVVNGVHDFSHVDPAAHTITVDGTGKASSVPDLATISFMVMQSAGTVAEAQTAATAKTDAALAAVKALGIADADVKTDSYNVSPQYAPAVCQPGMMCTSSDKITGYEVSQSVEVKVRDTSKAGDVLQKLGTLGVQNISGPNFSLDDDNGVKNEARAAAIANAQAKAAELAKELGVHLGKVVSFSESGGNYPYPVYAAAGKSMAMDAAAPAPSLPAGQNETTSNVTVTYEIR